MTIDEGLSDESVSSFSGFKGCTSAIESVSPEQHNALEDNSTGGQRDDDCHTVAETFLPQIEFQKVKKTSSVSSTNEV